MAPSKLGSVALLWVIVSNTVNTVSEHRELSASSKLSSYSEDYEIVIPLYDESFVDVEEHDDLTVVPLNRNLWKSKLRGNGMDGDDVDVVSFSNPSAAHRRLPLSPNYPGWVPNAKDNDSSPFGSSGLRLKIYDYLCGAPHWSSALKTLTGKGYWKLWGGKRRFKDKVVKMRVHHMGCDSTQRRRPGSDHSIVVVDDYYDDKSWCALMSAGVAAVDVSDDFDAEKVIQDVKEKAGGAASTQNDEPDQPIRALTSVMIQVNRNCYPPEDHSRDTPERALFTLCHEMGHALGLTHSDPGVESCMINNLSSGYLRPSEEDYDSLRQLYQPP